MQPQSTTEVRSLLKSSGELELSLVDVPLSEPADDQVVIEVRAAPINPSDLGMILAGADVETVKSSGTPDRPVTTFEIPAKILPAFAARFDASMPAGNEGAGLVVAAGRSARAQALLGKLVSVPGGAMYTRYRIAKADDCLVLPEGATAADGASSFVNPLTALGMVDTMRAEGHRAIVHTAAASNLGQMLVRICLKDEIGLVNVVRSPQQVEILAALGAQHICDSSASTFADDLAVAVAATGATIAFDAIGGGSLVSRILTAMEKAATASMTAANYNRYGSNVYKQAYIYGVLDTGPTQLARTYGFSWGVGGWLLTPFLIKAGPARVAELKARVSAELKTTFASRYTRTLSLAEMLHPDNIAAYARRATGEKYLVDPSA